MSYPGECVAVCAACRAGVVVPVAAGIPPILTHGDDCPRSDWSVADAILYDDGSQATVDDAVGSDDAAEPPSVFLEIGSVEIVVVAGLVRVTTTGDGKEATAYLHADDAERLAWLARAAAMEARAK